MRIFKILFLLNFWILGISAQNVNFKHDWDMKYLEHDIQFTSKKKAPVPFSTTGESQALMIIGASVLDNFKKNDLNKIVADEIDGIRKELSIDEYLEDDYKAKDNIVSYLDKFNNAQIAVIKYRTNGVKGGQRTMPRSTRQILFIHNDKLWISSLIVLFGEDQDNLRSDQMTFIKAILDRK
jgi:hypothetical protein